ncbi:ATP-binding protein [Rhizobium oryzicola]|uniref:AAA family ATPase n=1 Tax=Rhizobium oryzicola TaxID=1232668 RepID=A0ABT8SXZ8_9HYPH|nr:AAA family ATPase [Rhizobium oryzicola]MDO1583069.1 AAA family ATPase [Rhizobium oryzicola]
MRLRRLDLTRYGKFTDRVIDFGEAKAGSPDLHIVYGLNEAGKSTAFSAYLDLLFGIPERSTYNFLHAYNAMQVGGALEIAGFTHELVRVKQRTNGLLDACGQPVNEALLASAMGGLGRDSYRTMFSLDDRSLQEGGAAILESKGDLGALLFSASAGLADVSRTLTQVSEEALQFHRKRARNTQLAELKHALAELKSERDAIDTYAASFAGLVSSQAQAEKAYEEVLAELSASRTRHERLTGTLRALPSFRDLQRLEDQLAAYEGLPRPPREWQRNLENLLRDETRLHTQAAGLDASIERLAQEIEAFTVDHPILEQASRIAALEDGRARYRTAENDLPKRRIALTEQNALLAALLKALDRNDQDDPASLQLSAATTATLRDLIERRSGIDAELKNADREHFRVQSDLEAAQAETETSKGSEISKAELKQLEMQLSGLQQGGEQAKLALAERRLAELQEDGARAFKALQPWAGSLEDLSSLSVPAPADLESWRSRGSEITRRIERATDRLRELGSRQLDLQARISELSKSGEVIDDEAAAKLRETRDQAWALHKAQLTSTSAEQFEALLRRDDQLSTARLTRANDLAELRKAQEELRLLKVTTVRESVLHQEATAELATLQADLVKALPTELLPTEAEVGRSLTIAETWLKRRQRALDVADETRLVQREVLSLRRDIETDLGELRQILSQMGESTAETWDARRLIAHAVTCLSEAESSRRAQENRTARLAELKRAVAERQQERREAQAKDHAWREHWDSTLAGTWFADQTDPAAVRAILDTLTELPAILRERDQLSQRIAFMERDRQQFATEVGDILQALGEIADDARVLESAEMLARRVADAERAQEHRRARDAERAKAEEERKGLSQRLLEHQQQRAEITTFFGVETLSEVSASLERSAERDRLENRCEELRQQILRDLALNSFEEASDLMNQLDQDEVRREETELGERLENLSERSRVLYAELTRARDRIAAVGGDNAVARIEARRATILAEIEELAVRHLKLRAGALAAKTALSLYRDKHRSSMMARASDAFSQITRGDYSGLTTRPEKDREILIGVAKDGASKLSDSMSTGTRYQLYLALRLAGYEEFAAVRPAVPFVADDIMETFDELRSEEVFRLFGQMAQLGQVIYLTHHRHLCEIAQVVVPGVRIHAL